MRDHDGFTTLLGKHFRHNNYKSWVRQLNFYGFRKMRFDEAEGGDRSLDDDLGAMPLEGGQFEDTGSNLPPATPAVVKSKKKSSAKRGGGSGSGSGSGSGKKGQGLSFTSPSKWSHFAHPLFRRERRDLLKHIGPKQNKTETEEESRSRNREYFMPPNPVPETDFFPANASLRASFLRASLARPTGVVELEATVEILKRQAKRQ